MISSIRFLKRIKEILVPKIYSFGSIWEVCKSIVKLSLSPDDFISWSFLQISFILPFQICSLSFSIISEYAWLWSFDMFLIELLIRHSGKITLSCFVVPWSSQRITSQVIKDRHFPINMHFDESLHTPTWSECFLLQCNQRNKKQKVKYQEPFHHFSNSKIDIVVLVWMRDHFTIFDLVRWIRISVLSGLEWSLFFSHVFTLGDI